MQPASDAEAAGARHRRYRIKELPLRDSGGPAFTIHDTEKDETASWSLLKAEDTAMEHIMTGLRASASKLGAMYEKNCDIAGARGVLHMSARGLDNCLQSGQLGARFLPPDVALRIPDPRAARFVELAQNREHGGLGLALIPLVVVLSVHTSQFKPDKHGRFEVQPRYGLVMLADDSRCGVRTCTREMDLHAARQRYKAGGFLFCGGACKRAARKPLAKLRKFVETHSGPGERHRFAEDGTLERDPHDGAEETKDDVEPDASLQAPPRAAGSDAASAPEGEDLVTEHAARGAQGSRAAAAEAEARTEPGASRASRPPAKTITCGACCALLPLHRFSTAQLRNGRRGKTARCAACVAGNRAPDSRALEAAVAKQRAREISNAAELCRNALARDEVGRAKAQIARHAKLVKALETALAPHLPQLRRHLVWESLRQRRKASRNGFRASADGRDAQEEPPIPNESHAETLKQVKELLDDARKLPDEFVELSRRLSLRIHAGGAGGDTPKVTGEGVGDGGDGNLSSKSRDRRPVWDSKAAARMGLQLVRESENFVLQMDRAAERARMLLAEVSDIAKE